MARCQVCAKFLGDHSHESGPGVCPSCVHKYVGASPGPFNNLCLLGGFLCWVLVLEIQQSQAA